MILDTANSRGPLSRLRSLAGKGGRRDLGVRQKRHADHRRLRSTGNSADTTPDRAPASQGHSCSGPVLESCVLEDAGQAIGLLTRGRQGYTFHAVLPALSALQGRVFRTTSAAERAAKAALRELRRRDKAFCPRCGYLRSPADAPLP